MGTKLKVIVTSTSLTTMLEKEDDDQPLLVTDGKTDGGPLNVATGVGKDSSSSFDMSKGGSSFGTKLEAFGSPQVDDKMVSSSRISTPSAKLKKRNAGKSTGPSSARIDVGSPPSTTLEDYSNDPPYVPWRRNLDEFLVIGKEHLSLLDHFRADPDNVRVYLEHVRFNEEGRLHPKYREQFQKMVPGQSYEHPRAFTYQVRELRKMLSKIVVNPYEIKLPPAPSASQIAFKLAREASLEDILTKSPRKFVPEPQKKTSETVLGRYLLAHQRLDMLGPELGERLHPRKEENSTTRIEKFRRTEARKWPNAPKGPTLPKITAYDKPEPMRKRRFAKVPDLYDAQLASILDKKDYAKLMPRFEREKKIADLVKRDNVIAEELERVRLLKFQLMSRQLYFDKIMRFRRRKFSVLPTRARAKKPEVTSYTRAILSARSSFGSRPWSAATIGTVSSDGSWLQPRRSIPKTDLTSVSLTGYLGDFENYDVDDQDFDEEVVETPRKLRDQYAELLELKKEYLKSEKQVRKEKKERKHHKRTIPKIQILKRPPPPTSVYESSEEEEYDVTVSSDDRTFLKHLKSTFPINNGHCSLARPEGWGAIIDDSSDSDEPKSDPHLPVGHTGLGGYRHGPPLPHEIIPFENCPELAIIFPRKSYTCCTNPFSRHFWSDFPVNKYIIQNTIIKSGNPEIEPFLREIFRLDYLEKANTEDGDPAVMYYHRTPSQLGLKHIPDPMPEEKVPKIVNHRYKNLIPNNSDASSDSEVSVDGAETGTSDMESKKAATVVKKIRFRIPRNPPQYDEEKAYYEMKKKKQKLKAAKKRAAEKKAKKMAHELARKKAFEAKERAQEEKLKEEKQKEHAKLISKKMALHLLATRNTDKLTDYRLKDPRFVGLVESLSVCRQPSQVRHTRSEKPQEFPIPKTPKASLVDLSPRVKNPSAGYRINPVVTAWVNPTKDQQVGEGDGAAGGKHSNSGH